MTDRQTRWHRRLSGLTIGSPSEPLVLDEAMINQWLKEHRAEYNSATETIIVCLVEHNIETKSRSWRRAWF